MSEQMKKAYEDACKIVAGSPEALARFEGIVAGFKAGFEAGKAAEPKGGADDDGCTHDDRG